MSGKKKYKMRELKSRETFRDKSKKVLDIKQCPYCGYKMKERGSGDACGGYYWKCKNKKCGRTVWEHKIPLAPEPVVPVSALR